MPPMPLSTRLLGGLGLLCAAPALLSFAGVGGWLHPVLDDAMAGLALAVSSVALLGSAAFPWVIAHLRNSDSPS